MGRAAEQRKQAKRERKQAARQGQTVPPAAAGWTVQDALAIAGFFLSGAAGLIYEIAWIRRATLVFGATTYALTAVLAVFFLGLALGAFVFGRVALRTERPIALFARLEFGAAALAALSLPAFGWIDGAYGAAYRALPGALGVRLAVQVLLVALVVLPTACLMGGTLPLFCRQYVLREQRIAGTVGLLYAWNTLGGVAGCLAAGFLLIPRLGGTGTVLVGVALNLIAGVAARYGPRATVPAAPRVDALSATPPAGARRTAVAALFFLAGFAILGNEVLWARYLALLIPNTVYTYTLTLAVVLMGIVLGSALSGRLFDRVRRRAWTFGWLQAGVGLSVLALLHLPPSWFTESQALALAARDSLSTATLLTCAVMLLPAAVLSGASFPLAVRLVVSDTALAGRGVGRMAAVNTVGGIAGALFVGYFALPTLGLQVSAALTTGVSLLAAFGAWVWVERDVARLPRVAAGVLCLAAWLAIPPLFGTRLPVDALGYGDDLVDYREGLESNLAVVRERDLGLVKLLIDRWWQGQDTKTHQIMAAHVPMLLHPAPRRVLVVGAGAGQTPARFLLYDDVARLDCVDIEPAVFELLQAHFPSQWMDDVRVRLVHEDGRTHLSHGVETYDVIGIEVGQLFRPGVATFYTKDFYERARQRLEPGGLLVQFVPLSFVTPEEFRGIVRTFAAVFPQSALWYNTSELLLLGTQGERFAIDLERLALLESNADVRADLRYSQWGGDAFWLNQRHVFLAGFLCGPTALATLGEGAPLYRDDRPVLEYTSADSRVGQTDEAAIAERLRAALEPVAHVASGALAAGEVARIEAVRQRNLDDVTAGVLVSQAEVARAGGDLQRMLAFAQAARAKNPENLSALRLSGFAAMGSGNWAEGERWYGAVLAKSPGDAPSRLGLALAHVQQGRPNEALEQFEAYLELRPDDPAAHSNVGFALARLGRAAEARRCFETALELDPEFAEAHRNLAQALAESGDIDGARRHLHEALRLRPDYASARDYLDLLDGKRSG